MIVYLTKYALRIGIKEEEVEPLKGYPSVVRTSRGVCYHGEGREWHRTIESAIRHAERMRIDKIADLKQSIKNMESIDFKKGCI